MKILYGPDFKIEDNTVVAIGKFDGMHEGHIKVVETLCDEACKAGMKSVVYTFFKNPKEILGLEKVIPLMSNDEKSEKISSIGVDILIYENFNEKFANILPEDFIKSVLIAKLSTKKIIMGQNSTFGKNREGNIGLMRKLGKKYGIEVIEVTPVMKDNEIVSSTNLRKMLSENLER